MQRTSATSLLDLPSAIKVRISISRELKGDSVIVDSFLFTQLSNYTIVYYSPFNLWNHQKERVN